MKDATTNFYGFNDRPQVHICGNCGEDLSNKATHPLRECVERKTHNKWLAAVDELISEYQNDHNMTSSVTSYGALGALGELKSKMAR